eukprot:1267598-Pleurochrysis_carterae.AAC.1
MELVRSNLVASGAPTSFWTYAVAHSIDILNRTTGPPHSTISSYECLTNVKPRVMPILPFGCRAYAVKPRIAHSKTRIEPRALTTPGAYNVYVPSAPRVVFTSEVYFDEIKTSFLGNPPYLPPARLSPWPPSTPVTISRPGCPTSRALQN